MHQLAKLKPILLRSQFKLKWARTDYESQRWIAPRPTLPNCSFENNDRNMIGTIGEHCRFQCIFDFSPILETRRPQKPVRLETSTWIQPQVQVWIFPKSRKLKKASFQLTKCVISALQNTDSSYFEFIRYFIWKATKKSMKSI